MADPDRDEPQQSDDDGMDADVTEPPGDETRMAAEADLFAEIKNVEIFRSGVWNGKRYSRQDLDDMARAAAEMGYKPPVTLGHDAGPDAPAYGFVTNVRRDGEVLLADFTDVPDDLVRQIKDRRYDQVSSEIFYDLKRDGKTFRRALRAVAVLGAHPPGVSNLKPLSELLAQFSASDRFETTNTATFEETADMAGDAPNDATEIARLQQELATAQATAQTARDEAERFKAAAPAADMQLTIQALSEQVATLRQQTADTIERERQSLVASLVASLDRPPYKPHIQALAELATKGAAGAGAPEMVSFRAAGAEQSAPTSAFGVLKDLVRLINQDVSVLLGQQMRQGTIERGASGLDDPAAELNWLIADHMRRHPQVAVDEARRLVTTDPKNTDVVRRYNAPMAN